MREIRRTTQTPIIPPVFPSVRPPEALAGQGMIKNTPDATEGRRGPKRAFIASDPKRDYSSMYRAAFAYHEQHSPPQVDRAYWANHTPGEDDPPALDTEYWRQAAADIGKVCADQGNDPFLMDLLISAYSELEREYTQIRAQAAGDR